MSRTLVRFAVLLVAIAAPCAFLRAQVPSKDGEPLANQGQIKSQVTVNTEQPPTDGQQFVKEGQGTLTLTGTNTYTGGTTVTAGTLLLGNATWSQATPSGPTLFYYSSPTPYANSSTNAQGIIAGRGAAMAPTTPAPAGPVFYIITEGAGMGDSVRSVPCTGKETVLDAVGHVNGISQISSTKIWIARPLPASRDKSTILTVDWEAISRRGINTTNYTLMPGDRLVLGEDPVVARSNWLAKRSAAWERTLGLVGLTISTLSGLNGPPADSQVLKELLRKGFFTDDEQLKQLLLDAIQLREQENKKTGPKASAEQNTGQGEGESNATGSKSAAEQKPAQTEEKSSTASPKAVAEQKTGQGEKRSNAAGEAPPHELAMRPLPAYRIEPPDVIQIELIKLVPLPPYRAAIFDVLQIRANSLPNEPIDNYFMVDNEGKINLGPTYGSVRVAGLTTDEMTTALNKWLHQWLRDPSVSVQLARAAGVQPVTGKYLVAPDGTINLRLYGQVAVSGKTVAEARSAIQKLLAGYLQSLELSVDVVAYNSKVYYVIVQGAGLGDSVRRLPITGKETVLDAISQINGLSQVSSKNIWIARPSASGAENTKILPVDWDGITSRGATATNYQILPGDRVFIGEDPLVTRSNLLGKKSAPIERTLGIVGLTTSTLSGLNGPTADSQVLKEFVRKGFFTDDEDLKQLMLDAIHLREQENKKAAANPPQIPR